MNEFDKIDLTPFRNKTDLRVTCDMPHLMLRSWLPPASESLAKTLLYWHPCFVYPWEFLYQVIDEFRNDLRIQYDIRVALGLIDYGFIDRNFTDDLLSIPRDTPTEKVCEILVELLVEEIVSTVDTHGTTTGLDLEQVSVKHAEIAACAPNIIELRKKEIEQIRLPVHPNPLGDLVELKQLWYTAYGYKVLNELEMTP
jgi:hypothetical protein